MSLVPVPSEHAGATCAHCGAALVADQRYCLSCGQPASPVRLAFLDVLQGDAAGANPAGAVPQTLEMTPAGFLPAGGQGGANGWLRRHSGLLSLLVLLVLCLIAGLLIGHWAGQGGTKVPAKQVVEVKGLSGLAAAPATATTTPSATSTEPAETSTKATAKEAAEAKKEQAKETKAEKAPLAQPKKAAPTIKKISKTTGAQHQKEVNELGATPIETG
jgi:hypothetical protein